MRAFTVTLSVLLCGALLWAQQPIGDARLGGLQGLRNVAVAAETPNPSGSRCGVDRELLITDVSRVLIEHRISLESEARAAAVLFVTPTTVYVEEVNRCVTNLLFELMSFDKVRLFFHAMPQQVQVELQQKGATFSSVRSEHRAEVERTISQLVGEIAVNIKLANP